MLQRKLEEHEETLLGQAQVVDLLQLELTAAEQKNQVPFLGSICFHFNFLGSITIAFEESMQFIHILCFMGGESMMSKTNITKRKKNTTTTKA